MNVLYTARFLRYFYVGLVNLSSSVNAMLMFLYYEYPIKNTWEREKKKKKRRTFHKSLVNGDVLVGNLGEVSH